MQTFIKGLIVVIECLPYTENKNWIKTTTVSLGYNRSYGTWAVKLTNSHAYVQAINSFISRGPSYRTSSRTNKRTQTHTDEHTNTHTEAHTHLHVNTQTYKHSVTNVVTFT